MPVSTPSPLYDQICYNQPSPPYGLVTDITKPVYQSTTGKLITFTALRLSLRFKTDVKQAGLVFFTYGYHQPGELNYIGIYTDGECLYYSLKSTSVEEYTSKMCPYNVEFMKVTNGIWKYVLVDRVKPFKYGGGKYTGIRIHFRICFNGSLHCVSKHLTKEVGRTDINIKPELYIGGVCGIAKEIAQKVLVSISKICIKKK